MVIKMNEMIKDCLFFGMIISIFAYGFGKKLKDKWKLPIFNPLLIAILTVIAVLLALGIEYESYYASAKYLSYFLTPATVCLAIPLYQKLALLKKNIKAILLGVFSGVMSSMGSVFLLSYFFQLSHEQYVTLLPKSITTAIAMGISEEMGGIVTITVAVILVTGILGNMTAEITCKLFKITDPVAKGVAIGCASHSIGTTKAMEMGEVEGAMGSLAIVVAGLCTVVFISFFAQFM